MKFIFKYPVTMAALLAVMCFYGIKLSGWALDIREGAARDGETESLLAQDLETEAVAETMEKTTGTEGAVLAEDSSESTEKQTGDGVVTENQPEGTGEAWPEEGLPAETLPRETVLAEAESPAELLPGETVLAEAESPAETDPGESQGPSGSWAQSPGDSASFAFTQVGPEYFNDALFIGDSRTVGLYEYGQMGEQACFYAKTSLTVYDIIEKAKPIVPTGDRREKISVEEALRERQFGKIYLMVGINEMGTGTVDTFIASYRNVVAKLRELQPDAVIYLQSIINVGPEKNETDVLFNNRNIGERNARLRELADNEHIFYLDVNEVLCDENGCLNPDWTFDEVHLKASYYQVWKEYLLSHAVVR